MSSEAKNYKGYFEPGKRYTYEEYLNFPKEIHVELIDGVPYPWNGSEPVYDFTDPIYLEGASQIHQEISMEISTQIYTFLRRKPCKVFHAPFDVRLTPEKKKGYILEPDIFVVCDQSKLNGKYCLGAPDFVVEIISPSTAIKDIAKKLIKYQNAGVREIWHITPEDRLVTTYIREGERYYSQHFINPAEIPVTVLEGLVIDFSEIFPPMPDEDEEPEDEAAAVAASSGNQDAGKEDGK